MYLLKAAQVLWFHSNTFVAASDIWNLANIEVESMHRPPTTPCSNSASVHFFGPVHICLRVTVVQHVGQWLGLVENEVLLALAGALYVTLRCATTLPLPSPHELLFAFHSSQCHSIAATHATERILLGRTHLTGRPCFLFKVKANTYLRFSGWKRRVGGMEYKYKWKYKYKYKHKRGGQSVE